MQTHTDSNQTSVSLLGLFRPARVLILAAGIAALTGQVRAEKSYFAWAQQYDTTANFSQNGVAVAMDRRGNVAGTGYTFQSGREVYYTAKYDALTGTPLWERKVDRGFGNNRPSSVACDSQGNVIVTGRSVGNGTGFDYLTVKYSSATGQEMWKVAYNNVGGSDEAIKVVIDKDDHVIVTGKSVGTGSQEDYYTIKYDKADGSVLWEKRYDSAGKFSDKPNGLAVGPDGDVVVTGSSRVGSNECYYTIKYDSTTGNKEWDKTFDGPGNKDDAGRAVAIDANGGVAITGTEINGNGTYSFHTFRYFSDGTPDWNRKFDPLDDSFYDPAGIAVDGEGNVFVAGTSRLNNFKVTYYVVRYDHDTGATDWEKRTLAPGGTDLAYGLAVDGAGNPVVTGASQNENFDYDFYTVKYDGGSGAQLWEQRIAGPNDSGNDYAYGLAVDPAGNVAVTGTAKKASPSPYNEMLTLKLNRFLLTSGDPITGPQLTPAAFVSAFNVPAISDNSIFGAKVTVKDGKKSYAAVLKQGGGKGNVALAMQTQPAPDVLNGIFKSFGDPVVAPNGGLAFSAKISGVPGAEASGVWTNAFNGTVQRALQTGKQVPGLPVGVLLKGVTSISLRDGNLAALVTLKGATVKGTNSTALVNLTGPNAGFKLLRTEDEVTLDSVKSQVKKISVYTPPKTSPGHGRYHGNGRVVANVTLADKRTAFVVLTPGNPTPFALVGTNSNADNVVMGAKWKSFGPPAVAGNGFYFTALGTLQPKFGDITSKIDTAIAYSVAGGAMNDLAWEGSTAPDTNGALFTGFTDPVSNDFGGYAFIGSAKGGNFGNSPKVGLWYGAAGALDLVANVGMTAPNGAGGWTDISFSSIKNLALPGGSGAGPIFLATVKGKGVSGKNNLGLWGTDSEGYLRQLFRNGDFLGDLVVKKFTLLNSLPGCFSANRSFNAKGGVAALVNFTNKTSAIVYIGIP